MGVPLCVCIHLQIHSIARKSRRIRNTNGVSTLHLLCVLLPIDCTIIDASFEAALLLPEPNTIMTQILSRFVLNLRPQTRNLRYAPLTHVLC